jgi:5-methylcytosine-specific restriction endonuclease McrA
MIKEENVLTTWSPSNKKFYTELGYLFTKMGDKFFVSSKHLSQKSEVVITAICNSCNRERKLKRYKYSPNCLKCILIERNKSKKQRAIASKNAAKRNHRVWNNPEYEQLRHKILKSIKPKFGDKNSNWNENLTEEDRKKNRETEEYKNWRLSVYKRDKYSCVICESTKKINAHHICSYLVNKENRIQVENGITLCLKCHKAYHKKYQINEVNLNTFIEWWSAKWHGYA